MVGFNTQRKQDTGETHRLMWKERTEWGSKTDSNTREDKTFKINQEVSKKTHTIRILTYASSDTI